MSTTTMSRTGTVQVASERGTRVDTARIPGPQPGTDRVRRVVALAGLVLVVFALLVVVGRSGAEAELADPVAGHVVVEPGETLWDVAVETARPGVDPRRQLASLRELNGISGSHLDAWAVVLIPAR